MWTVASLCTFIVAQTCWVEPKIADIGINDSPRVFLYCSPQRISIRRRCQLQWCFWDYRSFPYIVLISLRKRTIFTCTANHLREKEWVVTSNWTVEMEQELDALSHHMLMAAINSQLPSVLEYLDKCRCTLQLTQASFMHFHKFDSKLALWLSMHVSLRLQLSSIVREVSSVDRKGEKNPLRATITCILPGCM